MFGVDFVDKNNGRPLYIVCCISNEQNTDFAELSEISEIRIY